MTFERFLARRYLFSGRHRALASVFTMIAFGGVFLGVFALIVVTAVMEGFDRNLTAKIIGAEAHITVIPSYDKVYRPIDPTTEVERVRQIPGVKAAGPVIQRLGMVVTREEGETTEGSPAPRQAGLLIQGFDLDIEPQVTTIMDNVTGNARPRPDELVIGAGVVESQLYSRVGQRLLVIGSTFSETPDGPSPTMRNARMAGIFRTGFPESDNLGAYTSLEGARRLFRVEDGRVDGIRITVTDPERVADVSEAIAKALGDDRSVTSWQDRNKPLFQALRMEKYALFIILLLVVLIAAFNIIGTLTLVVTEKTREIGIIKSMGATDQMIQRIFVNQGMLIGGLGTLLGCLSGLGACWLLEHVIRIPGVTAAFTGNKVPVYVTTWSVVLTVTSSLFICFGAAWLPARHAALLDPVEALRHD